MRLESFFYVQVDPNPDLPVLRCCNGA